MCAACFNKQMESWDKGGRVGGMKDSDKYVVAPAHSHPEFLELRKQIALLLTIIEQQQKQIDALEARRAA